MKNLVLNLVEHALHMTDDDLVVLRTQGALDAALAWGRSSIKLLWLDIPDPPKEEKDGKGVPLPPRRVIGHEAVYAFWKLWNAHIFAGKAFVIFTDIDRTLPLWQDLGEYESCRFGSIFLLEYDSTTLPGVKPSQRGMLMGDK